MPVVLQPRMVPAYIAWLYGGRIPYPIPCYMRVAK